MASPAESKPGRDTSTVKEDTDILQFRDPNQPNLHLVYWTRLSTPHIEKAGSKILLWNHGLGEYSGRHKRVAAEVLERVPGLDAVASYDMRGHGDSEGGRGQVRTIHDLESDLTDHVLPAMCMRFGTDTNVILGGHSLGGLVVSGIAAGPDFLEREGFGKVVGVVLSGPAIEPVVNGMLNKILVGVAGPMCRIPGVRGLTKAAGITSASMTHDEDELKVYDSDEKLHKQIGLGLATDTLTYGGEIIRKVETEDGLMLNGVPVLLIHGDSDAVVKIEGSKKLSEAIRGRGGKAKLVAAENAYHEVHNERMENGRAVFYDSLCDFVMDMFAA